MAEAILISSSSSSRILFSNTTASFSRLPTFHSHSPRRLRPPAPLQRSGASVATGPAVTEDKTQPKSAFQIQNLTTWLLMQEQAGHIDAELVIVLSSISLACKQIASLLRTSSIVKLTGTQGTVNVQGEDQKKLDVISNEVFCNCLRSSGRTGIIASEEEDEPVAVEETYSGNYIVVFDPIDGSANIDPSLTTGSIFGIYGPDKQCLIDIEDDSTLDQDKEKCIISVCQPGTNLLAAGYCLYSSATVFSLSIGRGVFGFTLDPAYGEFVLTHDNIRIPKSGKIYSFNEGNYDLWDDKLKSYLDHLRQPSENGKPYSGRYLGCLVGEIHRMLLCGGIYGNPKNKKSKSGNLRLLYECAPMSYLVEQAGGKATDGHRRILEINPEQVDSPADAHFHRKPR
ncbi:fructose-1,6-bisphosphatase, chloroplastic-like isoform X2 [Diospyros lotus]|uniref:fructose-1,6-bisphosphatase, chloroplastic-like isoform X2 n=1 Tax=Diospyros lotus TaxID=55363 RepID=UPI0022507364|nr:fructose-1,6-bisphosphatase, chloroplastic-like isoform X2 [Diospyros lotus]